MTENKDVIPELSWSFHNNLETGAIKRALPLLKAAEFLLKQSEATGETALSDEALRLLEKYSELAGASII
jgi:hypothetical protein